MPAWQWDIFCQVIDNYGDAGVCWRLAANLAQRGQKVRLWIDDPACLHWMAPEGMTGVEVHHWLAPLDAASLPSMAGDVLVEAFGCTLEDSVQAWWNTTHPAGSTQAGLWLNLEYLTAESWAARCHGLPSPVLQGPAAGHAKQFFYPGFTSDTGGLLREPDLKERQQLASQTPAIPHEDPLTVSLFCYEPFALPQLLQQLRSQPSVLKVLKGRGHQELLRLLGTSMLPDTLDRCELEALPWLDQRAFDTVLWESSLNFVRGEDSLVRALWAGQPFVWHIYPQEDDAHHTKLDAFLDWLQAPADLRAMHHVWNGMSGQALPLVTASRLREWQACVQQARARLLQQDDLVSQLLQLASRHCPSR